MYSSVFGCVSCLREVPTAADSSLSVVFLACLCSQSSLLVLMLPSHPIPMQLWGSLKTAFWCACSAWALRLFTWESSWPLMSSIMARASCQNKVNIRTNEKWSCHEGSCCKVILSTPESQLLTLLSVPACLPLSSGASHRTDRTGSSPAQLGHTADRPAWRPLGVAPFQTLRADRRSGHVVVAKGGEAVVLTADWAHGHSPERESQPQALQTRNGLPLCTVTNGTKNRDITCTPRLTAA